MSRPVHAVSSRALLLSRTPYGETSLVATVLSPSHGRVRLLAKGAYRPTSRFYAVLDAFHTLELEWRPSRGEGLALLLAGDWAVRRAGPCRFGVAYRAAWSVLETARLVARDGSGEPRLFALVEEALDEEEAAAASGDERRARLARVAFDLRALHNLGLAPALTHCATCGRPAPPARDERETTFFLADAGGRLCRRCAGGEVLPEVAPARARAAGGGRPREPDVRGHAGATPQPAPARLLERAADLLARRPVPAAFWTRTRVHALEELVDRFTAHHVEAQRKSLATAR